MKIKTITCHEVYNYGATLQEFALLKYLEILGHEAETINYKPSYLSSHSNIFRISNAYFNKNKILKTIYLTLKTPSRIISLKRKKNFDKFSKKHIKSTDKIYINNDELKSDLPFADAYICGSDQIWNSFFENGKDPAFYLDFVPKEKLKVSYAASFAIDQLEESIKPFVKEKVSKINAVSVRETSAVKILNDLDITNVKHVLDPVFLIDKSSWLDLMTIKKISKPYIFIYDFDSNASIMKLAKSLKKQNNWNIVTINKNISYADKNYHMEGPDKFLNLIYNANYVITNSFHAVCFSIIFQKKFVVFNRFDKINTRMQDLLKSIHLENLLIDNKTEIELHNFENMNYDYNETSLNELISASKNFLTTALKINNNVL
ncbi:polysaccharide pyruvyl transferase family protein [Tamlana sp. 2_MG-2023]|uniref:polysaccharide pyruvyl transferase family protein n=1 Tax=unclassified Tamlana TaxID=2614803 RepID=UPI0026E44D5F|nr:MULTISPECIES: polysaccharide pyruvyl transferase family protein [unclassified Tamlana]MDO6759418.1 polysaccharide pyruvyl transferase family protein [Tamlana sp. 2_MG-2023]MDO6790443.1 polysaccharide pyruvyl transferase family protein [Tamlana sp. 1_MG-2023]